MAITKKQVQTSVKDIFFFLFGGILASIGINSFTAGNHILNGGFTGIATILNFLWDIPIGLAVFSLNVPVLLLASWKLGKAFLLRTLTATTIFSLCIDLGARLPIYHNDLLLASIFGGLLSGIGYGLVFLRNTTTGGVDVLAKLLRQRKPHLSMGKIILAFDVLVILLGGIVYRNLESMLYAGMAIFVCTNVMDYILYGIHKGTLVIILSKQSEKIRQMLLSQFDRGVTKLQGAGGFTDAPYDILLCACYDFQSAAFLKEIRKIDADAFLVVLSTKEILGNGFPQNE